MTDTRKPPLAVTLNNMGTGVVKPGEYYDKHIFVHLDQFLAEVDKLGKQMFNSSFHHGTRAEMEVLALQKLVKEIKEGKA